MIEDEITSEYDERLRGKAYSMINKKSERFTFMSMNRCFRSIRKMLWSQIRSLVSMISSEILVVTSYEEREREDLVLL